MQREKIIATTFIVTFGTLSVAELERNERLPGADQWLGLIVAYFIISVMSDLGAEFASGFAVLLMVAALLANGEDALAFATGRSEAAKLGRPLTLREKLTLRRQAARSSDRGVFPH